MARHLPTLASTVPSPERRTFCGAACGVAAVAAVGLPAVGCGNQVDAAPYLDASLDESPTSITYGQVAVPIIDYPQLAALGGAVIIRVAAKSAHDFFIPESGVLVAHRDAPGSPDEFVAVQALCPHAACPLGYSAKDDAVECPCHGSRFRAVVDPAVAGSYLGQVTHLPARDDLAAWAVSVDAKGVLRVDFRTPLGGGASTATVVNGKVTIAVMMMPALTQVGGSVFVVPRGLGDTLVLVRRDANTITTLSAICTHAACKVQYEAAQDDLLCPCHGSHFAMSGALTAGPAKSPLKLYPTDFDGTTIVVHVV